MNNARKITPTNQAGFTLLELLMVVIIIAILAAIALPTYLKTTERSRAAEALQMLGTIRSSETRYNALQGAYSDDITLLDVGTPDTDNWKFTAEIVEKSATAKKVKDPNKGKIITIFFDSGKLCTDAPDAYGLDKCGP